jgi:hypothetical protein
MLVLTRVSCTVLSFRHGVYNRGCLLVTTSARLKLLYACDQCHSSQMFIPLTGWHCELRPNTEGIGRLVCAATDHELLPHNPAE